MTIFCKHWHIQIYYSEKKSLGWRKGDRTDRRREVKTENMKH